MSGDEVVALVISAILGIMGWKQWCGSLLFLETLSRRTFPRLIGWLIPPLAGAAMYWVLRHWASHDVRNSSTYIFFYLVLWFGWTGLWNLLLPYVGLSCRDDALERGNAAAAVAIAGGLLGVTCVFAGGNIGDGPGWWVVVFSAGIATALLLLLWLLGNKITRVQEAITVDRDIAAGWRTVGFFVGTGLILGRAVAGNWHSAGQTAVDFSAKGWPALILWIAVLYVDKIASPTPQRPTPDRLLYGVVPGLAFIGAGAGTALLQGPWK